MIIKYKINYSSTSNYCLSIRTNSQIQNPHGMSCQSSDFLHRRILPQNNLIKTVPVSRYQFITILTKNKIADLTASINTVQLSECISILKPNSPISSASPTGQQIVLMRRPSYSFNCSLMAIELAQFRLILNTPHNQFIIITPTG